MRSTAPPGLGPARRSGTRERWRSPQRRSGGVLTSAREYIPDVRMGAVFECLGRDVRPDRVASVSRRVTDLRSTTTERRVRSRAPPIDCARRLHRVWTGYLRDKARSTSSPNRKRACPRTHRRMVNGRTDGAGPGTQMLYRNQRPRTACHTHSVGSSRKSPPSGASVSK